ncbi:MAG: hypothetical protein DMG05_30245 [Acidobacteria bacterium]|nr:MAG: hypothetical protein DMG05_30245 [Acidobacteriota bacterium]
MRPKLCTTETIPVTPVPSPDGGEGRVNCKLFLPLPWGEGGRRPGEGIAADGARVFSVDGVVRCIIWLRMASVSRRIGHKNIIVTLRMFLLDESADPEQEQEQEYEHEGKSNALLYS